ncbi:hypothetical protein [Vulgatibacter sp.]|uniref:hypothetical protein n=1 Tax=Vulgatibacter sp. TaxID=1971226 RepID=UPI00356A3A4D
MHQPSPSFPPRTGGNGRAAASALLLVLCGCYYGSACFPERERDVPDEELPPFAVFYGAHAYEELPLYLADCGEALGGFTARRASVDFYPSIEETSRRCWYDPATFPVAGCWIDGFFSVPMLPHQPASYYGFADASLVADADHLADTALCHELAHRELYYRSGGDPDYHHRSPLFQAADAVGEPADVMLATIRCGLAATEHP